VVKKTYIPERGDFVWLEFHPQAGREQSGRRPSLVLSPQPYNRRAQLALVCPVTSQIKGYPFEVAVNNEKVTGVVLADRIRCLDWNERQARFISRTSDDVVAEVVEKIATLLTCG
jgi:mRNA interferase MazF